MAKNRFDDELSITKRVKSKTIHEVMKTIDERHIFLNVAKKIHNRLYTSLKTGTYDRINNASEFAAEINKALHEVSHDKHLYFWLDIKEARKIVAMQNQNEEEKLATQEKRREQERQANFGFHKIEILEGNIGYLDLRRFCHTDNASETALAAINFLANSDAIIIDLRRNGGGEPEMCQLLSSYFLKGRTQLNCIEKRFEGKTEQWWTVPHVYGKRMLDKDLYLLASNQTFSAAEDFIYALKCLNRATIVGETTKGGAHPVDFFAFQDRFVLMLPTGRALNPISGKNWEGVGIEPDVKTSAEVAFNTAYKMALEGLVRKTEDKTRAGWFQLALDELEARLNPVQVDNELLQTYVGTYESPYWHGNKISLEENSLYFESVTTPKSKLIPMTKTLFAFEGMDSLRIRFTKNDKTDKMEIWFFYKREREIISKSRT